MAYTVSAVAELARVSVRTLHHYDEIGLLHPSGRSEAGYRLYTRADLQRLQQVLVYRALGFALEEIKSLMSEPGYDLGAALEMQREMLHQRLAHTGTLLRAVDAALQAHKRGTTMSEHEMFKDFDPGQYEEEVQQRWGQTEAYKESMKRTARYGPREWAQIKDEMGDIHTRMALAMTSGNAPTSAVAMDLAEAHRRHIDRWFYPCSHAMHTALGEGYVTDERFTRNIDKYGAGLSAYLRQAIDANAARQRAA